ncbi:MAG: hypothetical protein ACFB21_03610 [Opitutales bacterium]
MAVGLALPFAWALGYAALYSLGLAGLPSARPTLQYWSAAVQDGALLGSLGISLWLATTITLTATTLALALTLCAEPLLRRPSGRLLVALPLTMPVLVAGFVVYQGLNPGGLLARIGAELGLLENPSDFPILVNDRFGIGIVLAHSLSATPLLTLFFLQLWRARRGDERLLLAASLGASKWQARLHVALPLLLLNGRAVILLIFILSLGSFEIPLLLGREDPQMFSVLIERKATGYDLQERPEAFALSLVYFFLVTTLLMVFLRLRKRSGTHFLPPHQSETAA